MLKSKLGVTGFSAQGLIGLKSWCQPGLCFLPGLRVFFQAHMVVGRTHFFAVNCRIEILVSLLAVIQGMLSLLDAVHIPYDMPLHL